MSNQFAEGHDAFIKTITDFVVVQNPYSALLLKSHRRWDQGYWDAMYDWKRKLTVQDCILLAKVLADD